jgi:hypothetical protein
MNTRKCDGCTKCCDGSLVGESYGHKFFPGQPCFFLILNKGCTIYEDRPNPQCTDFLCEWIKNDDIPDWLKPNNSDIIISNVDNGGINQIHITKSGNKFTKESLDWIKEYARKNNKELSWYIDGQVGWQGSKELDIALKKFYNK